MSFFPASFITIQNSHDEAVFTRHKAGSDLATICIAGIITVFGLVDSENDAQQFEYAGIPSKEGKVIHVLGPDMAPNVFGQDYNIGDLVSINGDEQWQIMNVTQSADSGNMIDISIIAKD